MEARQRRGDGDGDIQAAFRAVQDVTLKESRSMKKLAPRNSGVSKRGPDLKSTVERWRVGGMTERRGERE